MATVSKSSIMIDPGNIQRVYVSGAAFWPAGAVLIYDVPANSYAQFHLGFTEGPGGSSGSVIWLVNGQTLNFMPATGIQTSGIFIAGPGTQVTAIRSAAGIVRGTATMMGVLFTNS